MAFVKRQETITLPSGEAVTFRALLASEVKDLGISRNGEPSGKQMRQMVCLACKEPVLVDTEEPPQGVVSIYDLGARDELALYNAILAFSFHDVEEEANAQPFPPSPRSDDTAGALVPASPPPASE